MGKIKKEIYLENKTGNHSKFYRMIDNGTDSFVVEYGRIGTSFRTFKHSISEWDRILSFKLKKGYKRISNMDIRATIRKKFELLLTKVSGEDKKWVESKLLFFKTGMTIYPALLEKANRLWARNND
ncbi:hypothetical protein CL614_09620 [archaeon]|nr:hypothetical protein [archaeon]